MMMYGKMMNNNVTLLVDVKKEKNISMNKRPTL